MLCLSQNKSFVSKKKKNSRKRSLGLKAIHILMEIYCAIWFLKMYTNLSGSEMEYEFRLFDMVSSDLCVRIDRLIDRDLLEGFRTDILNQWKDNKKLNIVQLFKKVNFVELHGYWIILLTPLILLCSNVFSFSCVVFWYKRNSKFSSNKT